MDGTEPWKAGWGAGLGDGIASELPGGREAGGVSKKALRLLSGRAVRGPS